MERHGFFASGDGFLRTRHWCVGICMPFGFDTGAALLALRISPAREGTDRTSRRLRVQVVCTVSKQEARAKLAVEKGCCADAEIVAVRPRLLRTWARRTLQ